MPRFAVPILFTGLAVTCIASSPLAAQRRAAFDPPRVWASAWAGYFTDFGGFSDDQNTFFGFDKSLALGGSVHFQPRQSAQFGVELLYARPAYRRFDRDSLSVVATGDASVTAALASLRMAGGAGGVGLYLSAAGGAFFWNVAELDGRDADPALTLGIGLDYALRRNALLFGEYSQWWVYHQKDDAVQKNTANHTLLRGGIRFGF